MTVFIRSATADSLRVIAISALPFAWHASPTPSKSPSSPTPILSMPSPTLADCSQIASGIATVLMTHTERLWSKLRAAQAHKITPRVISSGQGAHLEIGGKAYLNFCSSHYLGFAMEPRLKRAAQHAIELYGLGTGYRTLSGTHALHVELEKAIAQHFKGTEAAVCFTSAYAANASAVQTLLSKDDIVVSDQLNHASVIDAVRLAGVRNNFVYAHSDMNDLEAKLVAASEVQKKPKPDGEHPLILIATDGVFSMDGDLAPLPMAKKYDALTLVDDAHGEGVLGKGGRGVVRGKVGP